MITLDFNGKPVRIFESDNDSDGEPMVAAMDVAENLGYSDPQKAIARICKDTKSLNGLQVITRENAYRLILCAPRKATHNFESWLVENL